MPRRVSRFVPQEDAGLRSEPDKMRTRAARRQPGQKISAWAEFNRGRLAGPAQDRSRSSSEVFGCPVEHGKREQQGALEAEFAILAGIPFALGMRATAIATGANRQRRDVQR